MRKAEIFAYTAGIIDGEGHIRFSNNARYTPSIEIRVTNTEEWLCQWLKMQYGGNISVSKPYKPNWKPSYRWTLHRAKVEGFLHNILPYLNLKRPHAELALSYCERKAKDKKSILSEAERILMAKLNKKGN